MSQDVVPASSSVQHGLGRGEGLTNDDVKRLLNIQTVSGPVEVGRVNIGQEPNVHALGSLVASGIMLESLGNEVGAEEGASDTDGDDVLELLSRMSFKGSISDGCRELLDSVEHFVNILHNISITDHERVFLGLPEGNVEHATVLSDVDLLARGHSVELLEDLGLFSHLGEELHHLGVELSMSSVEDDVVELRSQVCISSSVREHGLQVLALEVRLVVSLEGLDGFELVESCHS
mmetsp:Transcript_11584/g.17520  ORF Transcript_11584/g.17520 Transcript_11584/m.17520 type:complete len:234 (-) Transcript_11584:9-710(-)